MILIESWGSGGGLAALQGLGEGCMERGEEMKIGHRRTIAQR